jgi:uncharacterized phage protein gp47/JayE
MAQFNTPDTIKEINDKMQADVSIETEGEALKVDSDKTMIGALASRIFDLYRKRLNINRQAFINTCDDEYLPVHGEPYEITLNPATPSEGDVVFSGLNGAIIGANTSIQSVSGLIFTTQSDGTIALQQVTPASISRTGTLVTVTFSNSINLASGFTIDSITGAVPDDFNVSNQVITITSSSSFTFEKAGTQGSATGTIVVQWKSASIKVKASSSGFATNLSHGNLLKLSQAVADVNTNCFVGYEGLTNGTDVEDNVSYRQRIRDRMANPVAYFNNAFIESECKKISGITRVQIFNPTTTTAQISISSITRNDNVAIAISNNHGSFDNTTIQIFGASPSDYNVRTKIIKLDANRFAFYVAGTPVNPTGTITASYSYVQPGQVRIGILRDNDDSIIPSSTEVQKVRNQLLTKLPSNMDDTDLMVFSPIAVPQNFTFSYLYPNTTAMKSAITSSLDNYFRSKNKIGVNDKLASFKAIIENTFDSTGRKPEFTLSYPTQDNLIGLNQISTLGTITYP